MTRKTQRWQTLAKLPLVAAIAATVSMPAGAFQFYLGDEIEGSFDTTLTAGASWRTQDRDISKLAQGNLAPFGANPFVRSLEGASTNNYDDGNWNFEQWDTYSKQVKGVSELLLSYENFGTFVRGKYWYDFELKDESRAVDGAGQRRSLSVDGDKNASGAEFLDAYVFGDFQLGEMPLNVRFGDQVVSWGESTLIFNGINVINPVNVGAIRAPGAEVKEALLPVTMLYGSLGVTENLTAEAFVQLKWEATKPEDCGTFFSTNDFAADGCGPVLLAGQLPDSLAFDQGLRVNRLADKEADDTDQFGVALRYYAAELNDTEFGLYAIQYHSRLPVLSGVVSDPTIGDTFPEYFVEYPEQIQLLGLSFNTSTETGYSISGEYSWKHDVPVQWNAFELIYGGLGIPTGLLTQQRALEAGGIENLYGETLPGYDLYDVSQVQFTVIKFFDQVFGASRLTFVSEAGGTYVHDLDPKERAAYGRTGNLGIRDYLVVDGSGTPLAGCVFENINANNCRTDGFTTSFSWGYRIRTALEYNDVFAGVNLIPTLAWSHDVQGFAPDPGGNFIEGRKAIGVGLRGVYLNQYTASINYNNFFGAKEFNDRYDRDNISFSVSYSF